MGIDRTLQQRPGRRVLVVKSNGAFLKDCCCVDCSANCCCDGSIPPWFQDPITVVIQLVAESDQSESPDALDCLAGEWVLPYAGYSEEELGAPGGKCTYSNVFTAGPEADAAVFKIEAEVPQTLESGEPVPSSCITVRITFLSCKDCNGDVMQGKPVLVYRRRSQCNVSLPEGLGETLPGVGACACGGEQGENVAQDEDGPGYEGKCWDHPDADEYDGNLYLFDPEITGGSPPAVDLTSLIQLVPFTKHTDPCKWVATNDYESLGFDTSLSAFDDAASEQGLLCGYGTVVGEPYTLLGDVEDPVGYDIIPLGGDIEIEPGCGDDFAWVTLANVTSDGDPMYDEELRIKASWRPARYDSCRMDAQITTPDLPCPSLNLDADHCPCDYGECGEAVNNAAIITRYFEAFPTADTIPDYTDLCDTLEPETLDESVNCECIDEVVSPVRAYCGCVKVTLQVPTLLKADDFAPYGARYEVIYTVDGVEYSMVYTKVPPPDPDVYPKGAWALDWTDAPIVSMDVGLCFCQDNCDDYVAEFNTLIQVDTVGRVPATTLAPGGVKATFITEESELAAVGEMTLFEQPPFDVGTKDPCCGCELDCNQQNLICNTCLRLAGCEESCRSQFENVPPIACCCEHPISVVIHNIAWTCVDDPCVCAFAEERSSYTYIGCIDGVNTWHRVVETINHPDTSLNGISIDDEITVLPSDFVNTFNCCTEQWTPDPDCTALITGCESTNMPDYSPCIELNGSDNFEPRYGCEGGSYTWYTSATAVIPDCYFPGACDSPSHINSWVLVEVVYGAIDPPCCYTSYDVPAVCTVPDGWTECEEDLNCFRLIPGPLGGPPRIGIEYRLTDVTDAGVANLNDLEDTDRNKVLIFFKTPCGPTQCVQSEWDFSACGDKVIERQTYNGSLTIVANLAVDTCCGIPSDPSELCITLIGVQFCGGLPSDQPGVGGMQRVEVSVAAYGVAGTNVACSPDSCNDDNEPMMEMMSLLPAGPILTGGDGLDTLFE